MNLGTSTHDVCVLLLLGLVGPFATKVGSAAFNLTLRCFSNCNGHPFFFFFFHFQPFLCVSAVDCTSII